MTISTLPTDSLYKFMALAGLAMLITSATFLELQHREIRSAATDLSLANESFGYKDKIWKDRLEELKNANDPTASEYFWDNYARMIELGMERRRKTEMVLASANDFYAQLPLVAGGALIGITLMIMGFTLWYFRLQRYLDTIVRKQSKMQTEPAA